MLGFDGLVILIHALFIYFVIDKLASLIADIVLTFLKSYAFLYPL